MRYLMVFCIKELTRLRALGWSLLTMSVLGLSVAYGYKPIPVVKHFHFYSKSSLVESVISSMIYVPGGTFRFGPKEGAHAQVTLSDFYMTRYAITARQYKSYRLLTGHKVNQEQGDNLVLFNGKYPAQPTFQQSQKFCHWIGQQVSLDITLPTEEQWEYAARSGGKNVKYSTDNGKVKVGVNFPKPSDFPWSMPMQVNRLPPNRMGFYLMNANGSEWTRSCYKDYPSQPVTDPTSNTQTCKYITARGTGITDILNFENPTFNKHYRTAEKETLQVYSRMWVTRPELKTAEGNFRCVINSGKKLDLMKVVSALSRKSADNPNEK